MSSAFHSNYATAHFHERFNFHNKFPIFGNFLTSAEASEWTTLTIVYLSSISYSKKRIGKAFLATKSFSLSNFLRIISSEIILINHDKFNSRKSEIEIPTWFKTGTSERNEFGEGFIIVAFLNAQIVRVETMHILNS